MTETSHTRSRRASLYGLILQLVAFAGVLALAQVSRSAALLVLAWYVAGGVLLWFVALLVFRQRELAALEALDIEELRRERAGSGGGEGMFDEEGGASLGFRVAEARLQWMQRWLVPVFGLLFAAFLAAMGLYLWFQLDTLTAQWRMGNLPLAMIIVGVMMVLFFVFSRYASGMGRVMEWQLLRACGSYMLGNAIAMLAVIICLGVFVYVEAGGPERFAAYAICLLMVILAIETVFTFVLDIYRPRMRAEEARACFDSRLLALVAEPGGIASSIAEAMNYQFGFEVSQTWFYQLLQKWFALLVVVGIVSLWLLTCVLIVQPDEHAVIERFGRQVNAASPYGPGFYWKLPWPIDVARKYETSRLHQIIVGFKQFDAEPVPHREDAAQVALWSDDRHFGQPHFDFVIPVPSRAAGAVPTAAEQALADEFALSAAAQALPVNLVRMDVAVQYRIDVGRLAQYTQRCDRPEDYLRNIAWEETVRYVAGWDVFALLGEKYGTAGSELQVRINARLQELELGLEVVYVGVQNVHPAPDVAKEFRKVITAEQEKVASIRQALVKENETLSRVAGDRDTARALAQALAKRNPNQIRFDQAGLLLQHVDGAALSQVEAEFAALEAHFTRVIVARWRLEQAEDAQHQVQLDFELGLGRDVAERAAAVASMERAADELARVEAELEQAWLPVAAAAAAQLDEEALRALRDRVAAQAALRFWNDRLEALLPRLQGQAAATLAEAQATRWTEEMGHAQELARMQGERSAYRAAPRVYKVRKYLETLVNGLKDKRKFFLAFDQTDRQVRVRYIAEEKARADTASFPSRIQR